MQQVYHDSKCGFDLLHILKRKSGQGDGVSLTKKRDQSYQMETLMVGLCEVL